MLVAVGAIALGVIILWRAADEFVAGAARLAVVFKISPIVVGAVIVGFGTSAPEMLVSAIAATKGDSDVGVGNIIGSNIANLSLILGAAAMIITISISKAVIRREAPLAAGSAILFALLLQGGLNAVEGVVLLVALAGALFILLRTEGDGPGEEVAELVDGVEIVPSREILRTVIGLALTVGGAYILVEGALDVADRLGVSGGFIGVTLVAIGTSLPELVTAVAAAKKGETQLIVGNLLGSNLFNSLAVGGLVGLLGDGRVVDSSLVGVDLVFMLFVSVAAIVAMWTRRRFTKPEGLVFLGIFVAFLIITYLGETDESAIGVLLYS